MFDASMLSLLYLFGEAWRRAFPVNEWTGLFLKCFVGSKSFWVSLCSCNLISTFLTVSSIYESWHDYRPP